MATKPMLLFGITILLISSVLGDEFKEEIFFKPLPPTHLYSFFQFVTLVNSEFSCKFDFFAVSTSYLHIANAFEYYYS